MPIQICHSVCPHDCPSACALKLEIGEDNKLSKVKGDTEQAYTAGTVCSKVARYRDRLYHPQRLLKPLKRTGRKGDGRYREISWDEALDETADRLSQSVDQYGPESVWPYHYAGTMGLLQRECLNAFRHAGAYSRQDGTICTRIGSSGWKAGVGASLGTDGREMADTELLILWGNNAAVTQINVLTHYSRARKNHRARLVVIDTYLNETAKRADLFLPVRPGTDGALACAVMHVLLRENLADRDYLKKHTDFDEAVESHLANCKPAWAAQITGLSEQQIVEFALLYGQTDKTFIRLGVGLSRSRNGAVNVHAISCLPAVTGAWEKPASGALFTTSDLFRLNTTLLSGLDVMNPKTRMMDMCQIGRVLTAEPAALQNGPPVTAMIIQNTNPAAVAPNLAKVRQGLLREDLFVCVHEQFMTDTACYADILLPATMFCEHDDLYRSYGHTFLQAGPKALEAPGQCRSNHEVLSELARRLGLDHPVLNLSSREVLDTVLHASGYEGYESLCEKRFIDLAESKPANLLDEGFGWPDKRFRFRAQWSEIGPYSEGMPEYPDHWGVIDSTDKSYPLRLVTPTAKGFLNTSFNNIERSRRKAGRPTIMIHPESANALNLTNRSKVRVMSKIGSLVIWLECNDKIPVGVAVAEGIWSGSDHELGLGINVLVSDEPPAPAGGAAFHDTAVNIAAVDV